MVYKSCKFLEKTFDNRLGCRYNIKKRGRFANSRTSFLLCNRKLLRMMRSGETVKGQSRRGCRNSQAKGPVSDGTLESRKAPKKQSINRRIFQVSDRGIGGHGKCLRVPLFSFVKTGYI